jgi:stringent starvation protein B
MTQLLPPKKEVALALLERSNVDVYLDPRAKGVVVPPQFRKEPRLILKIGLNMPVPIPDLRLDDESMSCTLSFNRSPFYCVVPWTSVFAMVGEDGRGMVWPDDVPQELAVKVVDPTEQGRGASAPASPSAASGPAAASATERGAGRRGESSRRASARERAAQAQADDTASASRAGTAGGKRKKKKEEAPARPVLVAVPNAPAPAAPAAPNGSVPVTSPASPAIGGGPPASRPPASRPPTSRRPPAQGIDAPASSSAGRPKRELPPYLRVVK